MKRCLGSRLLGWDMGLCGLEDICNAMVCFCKQKLLIFMREVLALGAQCDCDLVSLCGCVTYSSR